MILKIFIHEKPVIFTNLMVVDEAGYEVMAFVDTDGFLDPWIMSMLNHTYPYYGLIVITADPELARSKTIRNLDIREAGGGVVINPEKNVLAIYRRGSWDLPKGKLDPGETILQASVREVEEETGVKVLSVGRALPDTYHIYQSNSGRPILKWTHWFEMQGAKQKLVPEKKEGIEKAEWIPRAKLMKKKKIYTNVLEVLAAVTGDLE